MEINQEENLEQTEQTKIFTLGVLLFPSIIPYGNVLSRYNNYLEQNITITSSNFAKFLCLKNVCDTVKSASADTLSLFFGESQRVLKKSRQKYNLRQ